MCSAECNDWGGGEYFWYVRQTKSFFSQYVNMASTKTTIDERKTLKITSSAWKMTCIYQIVLLKFEKLSLDATDTSNIISGTLFIFIVTVSHLQSFLSADCFFLQD